MLSLLALFGRHGGSARGTEAKIDDEFSYWMTTSPPGGQTHGAY